LKTKILITGANGFIGGFLTEEALRRGYEVWAGVRENTPPARIPQGVQRIHLLYDDPQAMTEQLAEQVREHGAWNYVIHNAGVTKAIHRAEFQTVNAEYTRRLLDAMTGANCTPEKFLLISSLSSYGAGNEKTFRPIHPDDLQRPDSMYGLSKWMAENYLRNHCECPYVILCPTGVYGPGEKDYRMEIESIRAGFDFAAGLKPQHLSFIYVKDLTEVAFRALENHSVQNRRYLVSDGEVYTDTEFARLIQSLVARKRVFRMRLPLWVVYLVCGCSELAGRLTGRARTLNIDKYRMFRRRNWTCDTEALRRDLSFLPAYPLRRGLEETLKND
jgi:nucleoside-diphosphate-sugar epimerase